MDLKLKKKQIKFLSSLLGPLTDSDYKRIIEKCKSVDEKEKEKIYSFIDEQGAFKLYCALADYMDKIK